MIENFLTLAAPPLLTIFHTANLPMASTNVAGSCWEKEYYYYQHTLFLHNEDALALDLFAHCAFSIFSDHRNLS